MWFGIAAVAFPDSSVSYSFVMAKDAVPSSSVPNAPTSLFMPMDRAALRLMKTGVENVAGSEDEVANNSVDLVDAAQDEAVPLVERTVGVEELSEKKRFRLKKHLTTIRKAVREFALIPQHTSPEVAVREIDALHDVVLNARQRLNTNNIMLLGDFNAGCSYVSNSDWSKIRLRTDQSYTWLIPDSVDTTVTHTNCPYDRIVVTSDMMKGVSAGSAQVFDFIEAQGLSQSWALAVSDHFPVEVKLL
ncbi:deoxyribonuclease-1-like [Sinocyclocheilus anshuiensis]|uniref:deoxyribonuclease-1-like n=1 Tax=Sinocyclocheilus anshuiensis TaxID=1608454 RepID=UPI0007B8E99C|nr:PREDICTED: deoxyribonuclease-1-like [Sinocyclocheilus anshuiensis]